MTSDLLIVDKLIKRYGGLLATDDLSLNVRSGELHAIIGPNGAGKTTLIKQLTGEISSDGGSVLLAGKEIGRLSEPARSHLGLARSFQITSLFQDFSVLENVLLAVQAHHGHSFRFWTKAVQDPTLTKPALDILRQIGLDHRQDVIVAALSHGEQRQLEIAMALASNPRLLLLDEPMAGMSIDDSAKLIEILRGLKKQVTILLIEHDMDAVFSLADRITVLVYGRAIATGSPAEIRANKDVQQSYLGEGV